LPPQFESNDKLIGSHGNENKPVAAMLLPVIRLENTPDITLDKNQRKTAKAKKIPDKSCGQPALVS
jgi:hypothetical protein